MFHAAIDVAFTADGASPFVVNATGAMITFRGIAVLVLAGPRHLGPAYRTEDAGAQPSADATI